MAVDKIELSSHKDGVHRAPLQPHRIYVNGSHPLLTRKRERRATLRGHHKIPHTRISRNGIVIDTSSHESDSLPQSIATPRSIQSLNNFNLKRALACAKARFASIARGYSTVVCRLQPVDRFNNRIPGRMVCYLAD
jgi:hypothetical protein